MKKKMLSILLCTALVATALTGCGEKETAGENNSTENSTEQVSNLVEIPQDYTYYYSFDKADDSDAIRPAQKGSGTVDLIDKDKVYIGGVKGDALYADGISGYKLTDVNGVGDSYTVSFWIYASRLATYMPTIQFGPDVHGDATGNQHYLNITRAEWSGEGTYPCIWSYDQADDALWPNWSSLGTGEMMKQWVNIALVVDKDAVSADGRTLLAKLYINGQEFVEYDSDGNQIPINVVNGAMAPSDNFDFLLGVNYWDATMKGAYDELYIYNYCLNADQIYSLYAQGNANAEFNPPERVVSVAASDSYITALGDLSYAASEGQYTTDSYAIKDGSTTKFTLKNWSSLTGTDTTDGYIIKLASDSNADLATVYCDASGTSGDFTWGWDNWNYFRNSVMVEADVTITVERAGNVITITADNVDYEGTSSVATGVVTVDIPNEEVIQLSFTNKNSYVELLSAKDATVNAAGTIVGNTDRTTPWWSAFSKVYSVAEGETKNLHFTNYTDGVNNWDNFVVILQNTPYGHSADAVEGYAEYAVVRADNFGWGAGYDGIAVAECDWNWDTFTADMDGAEVDLAVTNNGDSADIVAVVTTVDGKVYTQKYTGIAVTGDLYFCLSCEASYLSIDADIVGNTDRTTPWWSAFSNIWAVPEGQSKTVYFTNYTDGVNNWDNFVAILQNTPYGHSADAAEGYAEYAVVRADNFGWGAGYDGIATAECDWNWDTFTADMDGANVALTVTNNGGTADIVALVTTVDGKFYTQKYTGIAVTGDLYFCLSCEASYLALDAEVVGKQDRTTGWWSSFSNIKKVNAGESDTVYFKNFTDGVNNWDNFVVILQNTPTGHSADAVEGYAEYAVVRADNFGWGTGYDGIAAAECDWNWDTFTADMDGATVELTVTNNGDTADIAAVVTTAAGTVYHQTYKGIAVTGDLYYCLGCEASYLVVEQ